MTLERRALDLTFTLGKGSFGESGADTVTITGLRASATVAKAGGVSMTQLQMRVYGMSLSDMNHLSTLGKPLLDGRDNTVTVEANGAVAFIGTISEAWVDMAGSPEGCLQVAAFSGLLDALKPIPASSFQGQADVASILSGLATQMGLTFENNAVSVQIANPYYPGTAWAQAQACAADADINMIVDGGVLAIWPKDGARTGVIPLISAATGMVGYPTHTQNGIIVSCLYDPTIVFGGQVQVDSILTPAQGTWTPFSVTHDLSCETPGGPWFTRLECTALGHVTPLAR